jgi:hypothetical protein
MPETKPFTCAECAAEFKSQEELDGHNRTIHQKAEISSQAQKPPQKRTA